MNISFYLGLALLFKQIFLIYCVDIVLDSCLKRVIEELVVYVVNLLRNTIIEDLKMVTKNEIGNIQPKSVPFRFVKLATMVSH